MRIVVVFAVTLAFAPLARAQHLAQMLFPEQRTVSVRDPADLPPSPMPISQPPPTVTDPRAGRTQWRVSLDEAIRIALEQAEVVRVLTGVAAASSGQTIYDVAIANNQIDEQQAEFDPTVDVRNSFNRLEQPGGPFNLGGQHSDDYRFSTSVNKKIVTGGSVGLGVAATPQRSEPVAPGAFRRQTPSSLELSVRQPLLQGGGWRANLAPIVLARIDVERSYFQLKDSVQDLVRGVIDAYWALVFARTDLWARQQQVRQLEEALARAEAQFSVGLVSQAVVAQSKVALYNFRASLISSQANVFQREAALRNILGLPPSDDAELVPVTPPVQDGFTPDWEALLALAGERRPDVIELKLILEADAQSLLIARNQALPNVTAEALYRWNGLEGELPSGTHLRTGPGQFTDWTLAVNFSVPLTLRRERAALRRRELLIARDRAQLEQAMHGVSHQLAISLRNLAQYYEQYQAFRETRKAARINLEQQWAEYRANRVIFLNVLLAITDWGNAVSAEAQALLQYNTELANLERQTGTILETHGVRFYEERFGAIGPLGCFLPDQCYPRAHPPTENQPVYETTEEPAEAFFDLQPPIPERARPPREELPAPPPHS